MENLSPTPEFLKKNHLAFVAVFAALNIRRNHFAQLDICTCGNCGKVPRLEYLGNNLHFSPGDDIIADYITEDYPELGKFMRSSEVTDSPEEFLLHLNLYAKNIMAEYPIARKILQALAGEYDANKDRAKPGSIINSLFTTITKYVEGKVDDIVSSLNKASVLSAMGMSPSDAGTPQEIADIVKAELMENDATAASVVGYKNAFGMLQTECAKSLGVMLIELERLLQSRNLLATNGDWDYIGKLYEQA